jgi:hypothetical protein
MPTLIQLRLKATWTVRADTRKLHGLACALFEQSGADHEGQDKPFAVSPLRPAPGGSPDEWTWRAAWLPDSVPPAGAATADVIRVGHVSCVVVESTQRRVTHAALASGAAVREVTVSFGSPVFFSQNGTDVLLPDPRLIAGSWRRRWNASLPGADALVIGDDEWTAVHRLLTLAAFDLRTSTGRRRSDWPRTRPRRRGRSSARWPGSPSSAEPGRR